MEVRFTWDAVKADRNQKIHGISFETAMEVFDDPNHVAGDNYFIERWRAAFSGHRDDPEAGLLLVVFVDHRQTDVEVIHVISARKAVDYEESIYNDQFR